MGTTIETITVTRPMKVIAFTCCVITTFLMVAATANTEWIKSEGWREGLFEQCVSHGAPHPIPFGGPPIPGCHRAHDAGYIRGCAALCVIVCFTDFFGSLLTGLGLRSTDPNKKYKYYRVAIYCLVICAIALLLVLVIYPVSFSKELSEPKNAEYLSFDGNKIPAFTGSIDFDQDGIPDYMDPDDDNDGLDDCDDKDDDGDGILDTHDDDDDNDGVPDTVEAEIEWPNDPDADNDCIDDAIDKDDDNDGIIDSQDTDDDNDGIPDTEEADADRDSDGDGTPDSQDLDDDNDGIADVLENDADNDGTPDAYDADDDNDGIPDHLDTDDDGDGIPDTEDSSGVTRPWSYGFAYGVSWLSFIMIASSTVLLICDRESEEIFYKEKIVDDEDEEEEEEEA